MYSVLNYVHVFTHIHTRALARTRVCVCRYVVTIHARVYALYACMCAEMYVFQRLYQSSVTILFIKTGPSYVKVNCYLMQ